MAGRGQVRIPIVVDPSGVKAGTSAATRDLAAFDKKAKSSGAGLSKLTSLASGAGLAVGAGGLAIGIEHSIRAFQDQEKQMARVTATLKTLGINNDAVRKKIEGVTLAQSKMSGFQKDELSQSFATILRSTKDVNEAFRLNALAMDISRGSGKNLQNVALAVSKVADGQATALARYGVHADKGATSTDTLRKAQEKYAHQAKEFGDTGAGAAAKANAQITLLEESVGKKLAPAMNEAAGATLKFAGATGSLIDHAGGLGPLVAGGAGFGAFKLLAPGIQDAGAALGALGRVAGSKGAGASVKVLGSALADSVSPMTAVGIGAGLAAAGIYEIWHTSENADQAVSKFNNTLKGLNSALDQKQVAKDAVNSAHDYVKSTRESEAAARAHATALHGELVQLQTHKGTVAQVAAADKKWQKALSDIVPLVHARQTAEHGLASAQRNLHTATDGVNAAQAEQNRTARGVITQVTAMTTQVRAAGRTGLQLATTHKTAAQQAQVLAGKLDNAAASLRKTDSATSRVDSNLAGFTRHLQRLPTIREIKLVTKYTAQGMSLDQLTAKIASLHSKTITLTSVTNPLTGHVVTPSGPSKRTGAPFKPATGAYVAGNYSAGDRVPALLSGQEAVLNPTQIGMVDAGMTVMGALAATGAPTIGHGFASGKSPGGKRAKDGNYPGGLRRKGGKWSFGVGEEWIPVPQHASKKAVEAFFYSFQGSGAALPQVQDAVAFWDQHSNNSGVVSGFAGGGKPRYVRSNFTGLKRTTKTPSQQAQAAIDTHKQFFGLAIAKTDQQLANAQGTDTIDDDLLAYSADTRSRKAYRDWLGKVLKNPGKTLGFPGARLSAVQKTDIIDEITAQTRALNDDASSAYQLLHPDTGGGDTGTGAGGGAGSTPADTGPTPDQQAQIDQANARAAVATRSAALANAALGGFGSSGDIGTSNFANAYSAGKGGPLLVLGDVRSMAAVANSAVQGIGMQPYRTASTATVNV